MRKHEYIFGILGGGAWGSALYEALSLKNKCVIYDRKKLDSEKYNQKELSEVLDAKYVIFAISAQAAQIWLAENMPKKQHFKALIVASKGIDIQSGKFMDEIFLDFIPKEKLYFLSGPSFAKEVKMHLPTALTVFGENKKLLRNIVPLFPPFMKIYTNSDIKGGEVAGAYKNIIAIAAGVSDGLGLGNNAKAALLSRGLVEMTRFGRYFGAKRSTFVGLCGAGDLFLTSSSALSRNYRVGNALAKGKKIDEILQELGEVAEGVPTSEAVVKISHKKGIYTPIANEVHNIIKGKNPLDSLKDLLSYKKHK